MIDLFGTMMPIEAVNLVSQADDAMTIGEIRARLRKMAQEKRDEVELELRKEIKRLNFELDAYVERQR
jgi:hypothetical protein